MHNMQKYIVFDGIFIKISSQIYENLASSQFFAFQLLKDFFRFGIHVFLRQLYITKEFLAVGCMSGYFSYQVFGHVKAEHGSNSRSAHGMTGDQVAKAVRFLCFLIFEHLYRYSPTLPCFCTLVYPACSSN